MMNNLGKLFCVAGNFLSPCFDLFPAFGKERSGDVFVSLVA